MTMIFDRRSPRRLRDLGGRGFLLDVREFHGPSRLRSSTSSGGEVFGLICGGGWLGCNAPRPGRAHRTAAHAPGTWL